MECKDDKCAICHEDFSGDLYTLPECSHIFHEKRDKCEI